jgi:hypothetical protein
MIAILQQGNKANKYLKIFAFLCWLTMIGIGCQNKRNSKTMNDKKSEQQPAGSVRLFTVANLEAADNGRNVIAWFFETPQIFELNLVSDQAKQFYKLLQEAKEKQLPVNVHSTVIQDKNIIDIITAATKDQIEQYNKEKAKHQQPASVPPPPHN